MATIDPNIALGVKPIQIENPMNQYAAMSQIQNAQNQNALAQYQLSSAKRADEKVNFLNQSISKNTNPETGEINYSGVYKDAAQNNFGSLIPELKAKEQETEYKKNQSKKIVSEISKLDFDLGTNIFTQAKEELKQIDPRNPDAPAQFLAWRERQYANPALADYFKNTGLTKEATEAQVRQAIQTPQGLADAITKSMTTADQFQKILHDRATLAETTRSHKTTEGISYQSMVNASNPDLQGAIAGAKKRAEENVKFETQGKVDVIANRKALQQAGYDPTTGKDDITDLIKKSTGSYLGKAYDIGNRLYGEATEGSIALSQLEQKGNAITFGILNGKLGAGISTSDRQFIESLVSRMSDGTLPVDDRLAAWDSAKNMMKTLGMVDEPKSSTSAKPNAASTPTTAKPSLNEIFNPPSKK